MKAQSQTIHNLQKLQNDNIFLQNRCAINLAHAIQFSQQNTSNYILPEHFNIFVAAFFVVVSDRSRVADVTNLSHLYSNIRRSYGTLDSS